MLSVKKVITALPRYINRVNQYLDQQMSPVMQELTRVGVVIVPVLFVSLFADDIVGFGLLWSLICLFVRVTYITGIFKKISDWGEIIEPLIPDDGDVSNEDD